MFARAISKTGFLAAALSVTALAGTAATAASITQFDFQGKAGPGLLPLNGVGPGTPTAAGDSSATGGEIGTGISYNTDKNELLISFGFNDLGGGLFDAAGGIHLHLTSPEDPFNETGPVIFSLNAEDDNVINFTEFVDFGTESAQVSAVVLFSDEAEEALFDGRYYLNIHSGTYNAGELRGNLVPVGTGPQAIPTPAAAAMGLMMMTGLMARRRQHAAE